MKKCLNNNLVPNGLKVYVEPSIGNRDDAFLQQWHSRLEEFSKTLTSDVVQYCENEITKTNNEITELGNKLKDLVTPPEYADINKTISVNEKSRVNELVQRKNRKFYRLKYHNNNEDRAGNRNQGETWRPRGRDTQRATHYDEQNRQTREQNNHQWQPGPRNNNDPAPVRNQRNTNQRNTNYYSNYSSDQSDHDERVIAAIDQKNERQQNHHNNNNNYAAAVRNGRNNGNTYGNERNRYDGDRGNGQSHGNHSQNNQSRKSSFRNLRREQEDTRNNHNNQDTPLHERIALSRRNSRRNIGSNRNQENGRSRNEDGGSVGNKEQEIAELRNRLQALENQPEQVISHHVPNQETNSKNEREAQRETGQNATDINEMKQYLVGVLAAISDFDKRLTMQLNTGPTPSDRS